MDLRGRSLFRCRPNTQRESCVRCRQTLNHIYMTSHFAPTTSRFHEQPEALYICRTTTIGTTRHNTRHTVNVKKHACNPTLYKTPNYILRCFTACKRISLVCCFAGTKHFKITWSAVRTNPDGQRKNRSRFFTQARRRRRWTCSGTSCRGPCSRAAHCSQSAPPPWSEPQEQTCARLPESISASDMFLSGQCSMSKTSCCIFEQPILRNFSRTDSARPDLLSKWQSAPTWLR